MGPSLQEPQHVGLSPQQGPGRAGASVCSEATAVHRAWQRPLFSSQGKEGKEESAGAPPAEASCRGEHPSLRRICPERAAARGPQRPSKGTA